VDGLTVPAELNPLSPNACRCVSKRERDRGCVLRETLHFRCVVCRFLSFDDATKNWETAEHLLIPLDD
jgi:hypothetical protein